MSAIPNDYKWQMLSQLMMQGRLANINLCISFFVPSKNFRKNRLVEAKAKNSFQLLAFLLRISVSGIASKAPATASIHFVHTIK